MYNKSCQYNFNTNSLMRRTKPLISSPWCNNSCCCRVLMVVFSKTCPEVSSPPSWLRCTSPDLVTWRCRGCDSSQTRTNRNDPSESRHRNAFLPRVAHQNLFDHLKNEKTSQSIIMLQTTVLHTSDYYNSTVSLALRGHQRPPPQVLEQQKEVRL